MFNTPNLNLVNIDVYTKFGHILKLLSGNEILTLIKVRTSVTNFLKKARNNTHIDLVNINVNVKFGLKILSRNKI